MHPEISEPGDPRQLVESILQKDLFSRWLQIELLNTKAGYCRAQMTLRDEMINGLGVIHGGIIFSLADSVFAFACNNRGILSLALDTSISFNKACRPGDILVAETKEIHDGKSTGLYLVTVTNQNDEHVALFKGTCFRTGKAIS